MSRRRHRIHLSKWQTGLLGAVLIIILAYGCYTKFANPLASPYTIKVTFKNANGLVSNAPVRIAGVDVGKVAHVSTVVNKAGVGQSEAVVTMTIQKNGLPIHRNATFWIRPRIFLEGNFFVDLYPGTPESPAVSSGHLFPISAGREPVQFDQVLTSLQANTRANLQTLIDEYGKAVKIGGPDYNASIKYWLPAYKYTAVVSHDLLGLHDGDLTSYINNAGTAAADIDSHPLTLEDLITYFNTTALSFSRESGNLEAAVHELPKTLAVALPAFAALNRNLPSVDRFAKAFIPGVRSSGPTIDVSLPFISQLRQLMEPSELRGLTHDLKPTIPALAHLSEATIPLMKDDVRPTSSCVVNVIHPWSELKLYDGTLQKNNPGFPVRKVFQEAVDYLPGLAGETRNFDANGPYIRVLGTDGSFTYSLSAPSTPATEKLYGLSLGSLESTQPALPAALNDKNPPLEPNVQCETQKPITTVDTSPGAPISEVDTGSSSSTSAYKTMWDSELKTALPELASMMGKSEGLSSSQIAADLKQVKVP